MVFRSSTAASAKDLIGLFALLTLFAMGSKAGVVSLLVLLEATFGVPLAFLGTGCTMVSSSSDSFMMNFPMFFFFFFFLEAYWASLLALIKSLLVAYLLCFSSSVSFSGGGSLMAR